MAFSDLEFEKFIPKQIDKSSGGTTAETYPKFKSDKHELNFCLSRDRKRHLIVLPGISDGFMDDNCSWPNACGRLLTRGFIRIPNPLSSTLCLSWYVNYTNALTNVVDDNRQISSKCRNQSMCLAFKSSQKQIRDKLLPPATNIRAKYFEMRQQNEINEIIVSVFPYFHLCFYSSSFRLMFED